MSETGLTREEAFRLRLLNRLQRMTRILEIEPMTPTFILVNEMALVERAAFGLFGEEYGRKLGQNSQNAEKLLAGYCVGDGCDKPQGSDGMHCMVHAVEMAGFESETP